MIMSMISVLVTKRSRKQRIKHWGNVSCAKETDRLRGSLLAVISFLLLAERRGNRRRLHGGAILFKIFKVIEIILESIRFETFTMFLHCNFFFSLLVTHTSPLWENKPWVCTSQTTMFVWTHWPMCCTTHRSPWSPHAPWSI